MIITLTRTGKVLTSIFCTKTLDYIDAEILSPIALILFAKFLVHPVFYENWISYASFFDSFSRVFPVSPRAREVPGGSPLCMIIQEIKP